jgi:hypothetical protein
MCCAINFEGSCRRRTPSGVGSLAVVSGGGNPQYCPWGGALFTTLASQIEPAEPQSARFRYEPHHRWRADDACRIAGHETRMLEEEEIGAVVETRTVPWLGGAET